MRKATDEEMRERVKKESSAHGKLIVKGGVVVEISQPKPKPEKKKK